MDIEKSIVIPTIPKEQNFEYSLKKAKTSYSSLSKCLKDISSLYKIVPFLRKTLENDLMEKFFLKRTETLLRDNLDKIKSYVGTSSQIKQQIVSTNLSILSGNETFKKLFELVKKNIPSEWDDGDAVLCVYQYVDCYKAVGKSTFRAAVDYLDYLQEKNAYDILLQSVNTTRFKIQTSKEKRSLVINWPKAQDVSNGQRDILSLTASIIEAKNKLRALKNILVIDEIFDYLDDANLITFQYQVASLIKTFKNQGRTLYPILFTHVDPEAFNHWCFGKKKIHVSYLNKINIKNDQNLLTLVKERENLLIKDNVDKFFFHFHPYSEAKGLLNLSSEFNLLRISSSISDPFDFYQYVMNECNNYINGISINSIAVSFALRIQIEKKIFAQLNMEQKREFIDLHGTEKKLDFASECLPNELPDHFHLLGLIYNGILHGASDSVELSIALKLENQTIKKMICDVFGG